MALEGTLSYMDIAHLLAVVGSARKSGVLEVRWHEREARLYFQEGRLLRAESNRIRDGIGTLLVRAGLLAPGALDRALAAQRAEGNGRLLGAILCDDFGMRPEEIGRLLLEQFQQIVYDVFSWPGGRFSFRFREPEAVLDRFSHDAVEFIHEVGIQAGLLVAEGVAREQREVTKPPLLLLLADASLAERCRVHWRERGHRVTRCERAEEVADLLQVVPKGAGSPVVVAEALSPGTLGTLRQAGGTTPIVLVGPEGTAEARAAARMGGAAAYVRLPSAGELAAADGTARLEVFLMGLDRAVSAAAAGAGAAPGA